MRLNIRQDDTLARPLVSGSRAPLFWRGVLSDCVSDRCRTARGAMRDVTSKKGSLRGTAGAFYSELHAFEGSFLFALMRPKRECLDLEGLAYARRALNSNVTIVPLSKAESTESKPPNLRVRSCIPVIPKWIEDELLPVESEPNPTPSSRQTKRNPFFP